MFKIRIMNFTQHTKTLKMEKIIKIEYFPKIKEKMSKNQNKLQTCHAHYFYNFVNLWCWHNFSFNRFPIFALISLYNRNNYFKI